MSADGASPSDDLVEIGRVGDEMEARMVVDLLRGHGLVAFSDATDAAPAFGGLPFESGHRIFTPPAMARKAREVLGHYPHFREST